MSDKKTTVALGMIVLNEVERVENILKLYGKYFDEIQITVTSKEREEDFKKLASSHNAILSYFEWIEDFSAARNFNKSQCKSDYIFRLDADDTIENPERIRALVDRAGETDATIIFCYYDYSQDQFGVTNAAHYREVLYKNTDNIYWNKTIHENLIPRSKHNYNTAIDDTIWIKHNIDREHADKAGERNFKYLIKEYNKDRENTDPRTMSYLGRMFFAYQDFEKAKFFLTKLIEKSGWDEDRYHAWCCMSEIYKQEKDYGEAVACANEALQERPDYPDAYLKLHDIYFDQSNWGKAIEWGVMGLSKERPKTFMLIDPSSYGWRPILSLAYCYLMMSDFDKALKLFNIARKQVPELPFIKENAHLFEDAVTHKKFTEQFVGILNFLNVYDKPKIKSLLACIPNNLKENETLIQLKKLFVEPTVWGKDSIVIYCGITAEEWSGDSGKKGIGGSEEAVINMAKEWRKSGYKVVVYCSCGSRDGIFDGVEYRSNFEFNPKDEFNILIGWRRNVFCTPIKAKKKILWYHDVPQIEKFNSDEEINSFDKLVVLSKFHRSLFPQVPDEKIMISSNGINPRHFESDPIERIKNRCIYASSYDRGLEGLLKVWPDIRKEVPDAELHICYGFNSMDQFIKMGMINDSFKVRIQKLMEQEGVVHHGRLNHEELAKEYKKAEFYTYPCTFEEINCIALTKATASGCKVVTSDYAAVGERNLYGVKSKVKNFKQTLISAMKGEIEFISFDLEKYIADNSWETIAESWRKELFDEVLCESSALVA